MNERRGLQRQQHMRQAGRGEKPEQEEARKDGQKDRPAACGHPVPASKGGKRVRARTCAALEASAAMTLPSAEMERLISLACG
eukprot:4745005-Pleurochrysis_carterae.AAC.1